MLPISSASGLVRWDVGSYVGSIRRRIAVRKERKNSSPAARLGTLLMNVGDAASPRPDSGDPSLLSRVEAHIRESGDLELQQLVQEYLADI